MFDAELARDELVRLVKKLQEKKDLSVTVGPDHYDPGMMEYLEEYLGQIDEETGTITLRTESKGLRYEERTPRLDYLSVGDPVYLERDPENQYNANNILIMSEAGEDLGTLSAELCNAIAPLLDRSLLTVERAQISFLQRIRERSRYAKQGVLFVELVLQLRGI